MPEDWPRRLIEKPHLPSGLRIALGQIQGWGRAGERLWIRAGSALAKALFDQSRESLERALLEEWDGCENIDILFEDDEAPLEDGAKVKQVWLEIFHGSECEL